MISNPSADPLPTQHALQLRILTDGGVNRRDHLASPYPVSPPHTQKNPHYSLPFPAQRLFVPIESKRRQHRPRAAVGGGGGGGVKEASGEA